ncbi:MAG TPA: TonB-dependent receptor, partial [Vicinamibacterales bacterium]|nr:TonB-dependent receptor [Vicinamibacterales bacterium]
MTTTRQVDMIALAKAKGFAAALDPTVTHTLELIRAASATTGLVTQQTDPNLQSYAWLSPGVLTDDQTVIRVDHNLNAHHRLSGTFDYEILTRDPDLQNNGDVRFPGATNWSTYQAHRPLVSVTLRSVLSSNIVNELRGGARWSPSYFGLQDGVGPQTFADTDGYSLTLGGSATGWTTTNTPSFRNAWNYQFDDTLTWQRGKHNITLGGELYYGNITLYNQQTVPAITFGVAANDPVNAIFTTANFPGASTGQLSTAASIFATLTGRVTGVSGQLVLDPSTNQYQPFIRRTLQGVLNQYSAYAQDAWRVTSGLTINAGLRYAVQLPWSPSNSILSTATYTDACGISGLNAGGTCNFFQPGASAGQVPAFTQLKKGDTGYKIDWNNFAPSIGFAWRPLVEHGFLRALLGDPDQAVIRGAFSVKYDLEGHQVFTDTYGGNPGATLNIARTEANGLLVPGGSSWPVYLSQTSRLGLADPCPVGSTNASCNPGSPTYPIAVRPGRADSLNIFDPNI